LVSARLDGVALNEKRIAEFVQNSLMLLTSLRPVIGWDNASKIVHEAMNNRTTPNKGALKSG